MATYSISDLGRREILLMSAAAASFGLSGWTMPARAETKLRRTPEQILGPFYPLSEMPQTPASR
jgi:protocatechuate 3,4-dioxygenase beta subunit